MQTNQGNGTGAAAPATMTKEEIAAAIMAGISSALPAALATHDKAKTERRAAIMGCDEAKKRQKFAAHLADNTTMTADEAKALLANSAEEVEAKPGKGDNHFRNAMNNTRNPEVGADRPDNGGDGGGGEESDIDAAARLQGIYVAAIGGKVMPIKKAG